MNLPINGKGTNKNIKHHVLQKLATKGSRISQKFSIRYDSTCESMEVNLNYSALLSLMYNTFYQQIKFYKK